MPNDLDPVQVFNALLRKDLSSFIQRCVATVAPGNSYQHNWHIDAIAYQLERLEFPDLKRRIITEAKRHETNLVLIEDAGSGVQLIQSLKKETGLRVVGVQPKDDKATRLLAVSPMIEGGRIALPSEAIWLADYQREMTLFPNGKHDDQVDSTTQFLKWHDRPKYKSGTVRLKL